MSRNLLTTAKDYLSSSSSMRIAHLVRLETSSNPPVSIYLTDYLADILHNGVTYSAGKITNIGDIKQSQGLANYKLTVTVAGEFEDELGRGLTENLDTSYVGRDVEVLRAYLDTDGSIIDFDDVDRNDVGTGNKPMQYFIGGITNIDITEGVTAGTSTVVWQCAGKFADFDAILGRQTDDGVQRGLQFDEVTGRDVASNGAKLISHQTDRGFQHAAQTIDVTAKYTTTRTAYRTKKTRWWKKSKKIAYIETDEHDLVLGIDLEAKFIPKVYGVRKIAGIPVFLDVLADDPTKVYIVYAFAEGEIDAFLNLYLEGKSLICNGEYDKDTEACLGSKIDGDTLSAFMSVEALAEVEALRDKMYRIPEDAGDGWIREAIPPIDPIEGIVRTEGTRHLKGITGGNNLDDETISHFTIEDESGTKEVWMHHGKPDQNANQVLVDIAAAGNFFNQAEWVAEDPTNRTSAQYWDDECQLLDTAYMVMHISISPDEDAELPEVEAVIQSSNVSTYSLAGVETPKQYSLNPVWHLLDYITSPVYGGGSQRGDGVEVGLRIEDIDVASFAAVAARLDVISTTYENDWLKYWRYSGWRTAPILQSAGEDPQKTVMQCNSAIKTENTVTKNTQAMLDQFDATLNILGGKYHLSVETDDPTIADIDVSEAMGSIKTKDLSSKSKWNSIQASIIDPSKGWSASSVNFYQKEFLDQDNGVKKKGRAGFNFITNYYTAREWAARQLRKSRFSRQVTITLGPKYAYLYPNANVTLSYKRFWDAPKKFRVGSMTLKSNGTVDVTLQDYDSSIFVGDAGARVLPVLPAAPGLIPPINLEYIPLPDARFDISTASTNDVHGILVWEDPVSSAAISRYDVRDWQEVTTDYTVPYSQTVLDTLDSKTKHYIFITGLKANSPYKLKVRTISAAGRGSMYAVLPIATGSVTEPVEFVPVTSFSATNATLGYFDGGDLSMGWDEHPYAQGYEIDIRDASDTVSLRSFTLGVATVQYTYTLALNIEDYALANGSAVGASRSFIPKIRATNGQASASANFRSSTWTTLI